MKRQRHRKPCLLIVIITTYETARRLRISSTRVSSMSAELLGDIEGLRTVQSSVKGTDDCFGPWSFVRIRQQPLVSRRAWNHSVSHSIQVGSKCSLQTVPDHFTAFNWFQEIFGKSRTDGQTCEGSARNCRASASLHGRQCELKTRLNASSHRPEFVVCPPAHCHPSQQGCQVDADSIGWRAACSVWVENCSTHACDRHYKG